MRPHDLLNGLVPACLVGLLGLFNPGGFAYGQVHKDRGGQAREHVATSETPINYAVEGPPPSAAAGAPSVPPGPRAAAGLENFYALNAALFANKYRDWHSYGRTIRAAIFDQGAVLATHQEFTGGPAQRVTVKTQKPPSVHSTEVASVMAAWGEDLSAIGIARNLRLDSYDWDGDLKTLSSAAKTIKVTNHSYVKKAGWWLEGGVWYWWGDPNVDKRRDSQFGKYTADVAEFDRILAANPGLLAFVAAGNTRGLKVPTGPFAHRVRPDPVKKPNDWVVSQDERDSNDVRAGCDTIAGLGLAKNAICIGAAASMDDLFESIQPTSFSSWGPSDDGRVKPDLVAIGDRVHVASDQANDAYADVPGTSFATPAVSGIGALLSEFYSRFLEDRGPPPADMIKAVLIHSARDAGRPGPDSQTGWGLVDALEAGHVIDTRQDPNRLLVDEEVGASPKEYTYIRPDNAGKRLRVTLAWTDPAAPANIKGRDDDTGTLVNDLDVEVIPPGGRPSLQPYSLDRTDPLRRPTTDGPNRFDNVEVIDVGSEVLERIDPRRGAWTIRVRAERLGQGATQRFALVVSAMDDRAYQMVLALRRRGEAETPAAPTPNASAPTLAAKWEFLGPRDRGGVTRAILIRPDRPETMWAGSVYGGLWRSVDGGKLWSIVPGSLESLPVCALAIDPIHPDVLYAGTGNGFYTLDSLRGEGIFKSTDGGANWRALPATTNSSFMYVNRLAISPDGRTLLAATRLGLFRSTDGGESFEAPKAPADVDALDADFNPLDGSRCVAGCWNSRVLYSEDGGVRWEISRGLTGPDPKEFSLDGRVELTYARQDPKIIYASVDRNSGEIWKSIDSGRSFELYDAGANYLEWQGWYNNTVWAGDPTDANLVIVGGVDLFRSTKSGRDLKLISPRDRPGSPGPFHHCIVSHPQFDGVSNKTVYLGLDGGVFRAADIRAVGEASGWDELNVGYSATVVRRAAGNPHSGVIIAGTYQNATLLRESNGEWQGLFPGEGGVCAVDPTDPNAFYGEYTLLRIQRTLDRGKRWDFISQGKKPLEDAGSTRSLHTAAPFLLDPNEPRTMLAGGESLWRCSDAKKAAPEWAAIKEPIKRGGIPSFISAIAIAPKKREVIWVRHIDGAIFKTTDGTADRPAWTRVDVDAPLPKRTCTRIVIAPTDPQTVYATFGGYADDNIWMTNDGGASWKSLGATLFPQPIYSMAIHPERPEVLYFGTESGVMISLDGGRGWSVISRDAFSSPVTELFWMERRLVAATQGRGLWQTDQSRPAQ
jgi:photosystem II stability/assembly factor-like uncharacterized protein